MLRSPRMNRHCDERSWLKRRIPSWIFILSVSLLSNVSVAGAADRLVLISPHWEGIKNEFEREFKEQYLRETGRTVDLEWMDVGGTSEALRFLRSEFKSKPEGIGIDIFFGGGLEPYLALKQENLLESYMLPQELLEKIPPRLGGVPLYDPGYTWYGATLAGFGIVYNKVVLQLIKQRHMGRLGVASGIWLGGFIRPAQERQRTYGLRDHSPGVRLGERLADYHRDRGQRS